MMAKVLDTTVRIPGTSWYIGLDPLLGLIPGIGDVLANLIGTIILGLATRLQLPRIVLARHESQSVDQRHGRGRPVSLEICSRSGFGAMREMPRCFARRP